MAGEIDIDKVQKSIKIERVLARMVEKKFGKEGDDGKTVAYVRALEEATRGFQLTVEDYEEIAKEAKQALETRIINRNRKAK